MTTTNSPIAITGLAAISSAGVGLDPLRETLAEMTSRLRPMPDEIVGEGGHLWGKAEDFRAADFMPPLKARKFDRCSLFATIAAGMALKDAGIDPAAIDPTRVGIVLGCGFGGIANSEEFLRGYFTKGTDGLVPMLFPNTVPNAPASNASIEHRMKGPNVTLVQRFCSAESAFLLACRYLEEGRADIMLTGGVDELHPTVLRAFRATGQLRSHGRNFAEGSGILVLETVDHARQRGATVKGTAGEIRAIGRFVAGNEEEGRQRLTGSITPDLVSLSGTAAEEPLLPLVPATALRLRTGELIGRSLAMGGLAMVSLLLSLRPGEHGLHLAASPEGPYYAIDFQGGAPV